MLPQLRHFLGMFQIEQANRRPYNANISKMSLRLFKLQKLDKNTLKIWVKNRNKYKKVDRILHYQKLLFIF